jgi:hypothetical protein
MIVVENLTIDTQIFIKTHSDCGYYIQKEGTNEIYCEANDTFDATFTYKETDIKIDDETY